MPHIKFCGIQRAETVEALNLISEEQLKYIGFVLAPSRRQVSLAQLKALTAHLSPKFIKVGVFVNPTTLELEKALASGIQVLQFHGDETVERIQRHLNELFGKATPTDFQIWKALRIGMGAFRSDDLPWIQDLAPLIDKYLLDKLDPAAYGGTGIPFDWRCLQALPIESQKVVIAGGVNEGNVKTLLSSYQPSVIDLSSGIETGGEKDVKKMAAFLQAFKESSGIQSQTML